MVQRLLTGLHHPRLPSEGTHRHRQGVAGHLIVVGDEQRDVLQALVQGLGPLPLLQPDAEPEFAPLAKLAGDADIPPHQIHQAATDGQTKPGAPEAATGGGVCLGECIENVGLLLGGNADPGVAHPKQQGGHAVLL